MTSPSSGKKCFKKGELFTLVIAPPEQKRSVKEIADTLGRLNEILPHRNMCNAVFVSNVEQMKNAVNGEQIEQTKQNEQQQAKFSKYMDHKCEFCGKRGKSKKCMGCKLVYYCDAECQKK